MAWPQIDQWGNEKYQVRQFLINKYESANGTNYMNDTLENASRIARAILNVSSCSSVINEREISYLCTKNETMAPLHTATLTVQRELPKYEIIFSI